MFRKIIILTLILAFTYCQTDYKDLYNTGSACSNGRLQSPVVLSESNSKYYSTNSIVYLNYLPIKNVRLDWSDDERILSLHTANKNSNFGYIGFQNNGYLNQYALVGLEINIPAEHQINDNLYDAEIKLIHEKVLSYDTGVNNNRIINDANTHLVISLLYSSKGKSTDNGFLDYLLSTLDSKYTNNAINSNNDVSFDLNSFGLIQDRPYYVYSGSFTSFPCDEVVNNVVIADGFYLNSVAKEILKNAYSKYLNSYAAKPTSKLYGRTVTRNYLNSTETPLSSSFITFNLVVLLFIMFLL